MALLLLPILPLAAVRRRPAACTLRLLLPLLLTMLPLSAMTLALPLVLMSLNKTLLAASIRITPLPLWSTVPALMLTLLPLWAARISIVPLPPVTTFAAWVTLPAASKLMLPVPLTTLANALLMMSPEVNVCSNTLPLPLAETATLLALLPSVRVMLPDCACSTILPLALVVRSD